MPRNRKVSTASARYAVAHVVIEVHTPLSRSNTARIVSHRIVPAADILSPHYTILHTHARTHAHTTHTHARALGSRRWHMGFYSWQHTPTWRGYQSFLGFYGGGEDYFAHTAGAGSESPGPKLSSGFDFRFDNGADCGSDCSIVLRNATGKYSTTLFAERGVQVVSAGCATHDVRAAFPEPHRY